MRYGHFIMSIFCAWVMWSGLELTWMPLGGTEEREHCYNMIKIYEEKRTNPNIRYVCLPDTVDPRAPKAGQ